MKHSKLYSAVAATLMVAAGWSANSGACVLEIAPGATIAGASSEDFLIIEQGCQIDAEGTAEQPIIFTAMDAVMGEVEDNVRGLWGGLVINGRAPINDCPQGAAGGTAECTKEGEANSGIFGGDQPEDSSGVLKYVSVSYAGSNVDPENQLNGIAFQAVGSGTTVDFVQVHNNLDDGIEFFGGTVNAGHVVLTGNADDSLDWTDGWTGSIQWLYIEQTGSADNIIEADSREGDEGAQPRSLPSISNMSAYGNASENGLRLRRGTGLHLSNTVLQGSASCIRVDGTSRDLLGSELTVGGTSFNCNETHSNDDDGAVEAYLDSADEVSQIGGSVNAVTAMGDFFQPVDYVGAFGDEDWTAGWTVAGSVNNVESPDFACPEGTSDSSEIAGLSSCLLSGTYTSDLTLKRGAYYLLDGKVVIGGDNTDSAVLTLQSGVTLVGDDPEDFLVISRGSHIVANGDVTAPVLMTAIADVEGSGDLSSTRGLWGGLVINGNAPINDCPEGAEGGTVECTKEGEANSGLFGGDQPDDSSGELNYLVVKYAGSNVDPENQLNGIAFQAVGAGTSVNYIQVHNNLDDGIEFFGGTVNARHVALTGNADDSLDWTDGWTGNIQYLYIEQAGDAADNIIEADSREGDEGAEPRSLPSISNMSAYGNGDENGLRLRRGTGLHLSNTLMSSSASCIRVDGTSRDLLGSSLTVAGTSFDCADTHSNDDDSAVADYLDSAEQVSQNGGSVNPVSADGDFFEDVDFVGAIGEQDWTLGWTVEGSINNAQPSDFACPSGTTAGSEIAGMPSCMLSGTLIADTTLVRGGYYVLDGKVVVGGDNIDSAVLSVQSGVTIVGDDAEDFLVISRGSQFMAKGTASAPVTLTGLADVEGGSDLSSTRGLWGGLVINGNAPINDCPEGAIGGTVECTKEGEANSGLFGGASPDDSSGVLQYLVIKYAGSNVDPENQLNGIAFQGVGSGTLVDFIQVHNNLDDGVEFFGGTVNASHVVLSGNADDSLDWTDGWVGKLQFVHIVQADDAADNGIEADNREGDENAEPRSNPSIANMSIQGNGGERAIRLRRGTGADIFNTAVTGSATCIDVSGESLQLLGSDINFEGISFSCPEVVDGDNPDLQNSVDGAPNMTQDGSIPAAVTLPDDGFFEDSSVVGSDFDSWKGSWVYGL